MNRYANETTSENGAEFADTETEIEDDYDNEDNYGVENAYEDNEGADDDEDHGNGEEEESESGSGDDSSKINRISKNNLRLHLGQERRYLGVISSWYYLSILINLLQLDEYSTYKFVILLLELLEVTYYKSYNMV